MGRGRDLNGHLWREPRVRQAQARAFGFGCELPSDDAPLPGRDAFSGLDVALVLEDARRVPREDASRHMNLRAAAPELDASVLPAFDDRLRHVPTLQVIGAGNRVPHLLDRVTDVPLERERRRAALVRHFASARCQGGGHRDRFRFARAFASR